MFKATVRATLSLGLLVSGSTLAQSTTDGPSDLDQIVVTGSRTPLTISRLGSSATVITRDDIERRQARYVTDFLRAVPGFSVSRSGVLGSQTQVRVRGAEANHVLVLIDGVRANDPATGDEFRWEHLTTSNVERIEIVRGPQSSLWGSDAVAAVVHVITRNSPNNSVLNTYVEGGTNQTANVGVDGAINSANWSLSGGIELLDTDGGNVAREGNERDGADATTASLAARYVATDALKFDVRVRAVDAYSQFDPVDFVGSGLPVDGDRATDTEQVFSSLSTTLATHEGRATHRATVGYFDSTNRNLTDGQSSSSSASDRATLTLQSDLDVGANGNRLSLAVEHERTRFEQRGEVGFGDPNQNQEMDITSAVVDFQGRSSDRLTWLLSARYDDNSDFENIVTGRASLAYQLADATTLRANVGTGQKNPTFTERFGFFPGQFIGNPELDPERSTSYEVGLDQSFLDGELVLQISLFQQDLEDEINGFVFDPNTFLSTAQNRDGESVRRGIELQAQWRLNEQVGLSATYTYTDSTEPDLFGNDIRELRRPLHAGNLSVDFQSSNERFRAMIAADYGGSRRDAFFPPFPAASQTVVLADYWLVDMTLQYQITPSVSVFARGTNLLDDDYEQVFGYQTLGRAGYLGIRLNFGPSE